MLISLLGTTNILAILILFYILARLSEKFGAVIKMPPLYRYYYMAALPILIGFGMQLYTAVAKSASTNTPKWLTEPWILLVVYYLPLSIGVTIGLFVTWRYWRWLITERNE